MRFGDKRKIELGAVGDTKNSVSEGFSRIGKNAGISLLYMREVTLKGINK